MVHNGIYWRGDAVHLLGRLAGGAEVPVECYDSDGDDAAVPADGARS